MAEAPEGVLLVDKPAGPTSHDVVAAVRRALGGARAGHAGTLDPFATGLLLVLVGRATRLAEYASALDKTYVATLRFGASSTTDDAEGEIAERPHDRLPDEGEVRAALAALVGEIEQVPPRFSAKRVDGERAYRMARGGRVFTLEARPVRVNAAELLLAAPPQATFRFRTGPGVYVRSLARDLGEAVGSAAYLTALRREAVGSFDVADAVRLSETPPAELARRLLPDDAVVSHLPAVELDAAGAAAAVHGRTVPGRAPAPPGATVRLVAPGGFLGIGEIEGEDRVRPRKVLHPERAG